jgi:hypothetical protein
MLSHMQVFNEYIMPATIETLAQMVDKFNAASGGAIRLTTQGFTGDFLQQSFFAAVHSARRRVDRYTAQAAATPTDLTQIRNSGVKIAGGFGPIRFEPSQLTWLQHPTTVGVEVASKNFAEALMQDQLNTAILALVTAIGNQPTAVNDISGTALPGGAMSYSAINGAHAKFGDASGQLVAQVMSGASAHALIGQNLANAAGLFDSSNVNVIDILGKRVIITDAPALYEVLSANDKEKVLSLVNGAAIVYDGGDVISNVQTSNGQTRIESTMQVDYSFGLSLKGYTWDETSGGKSPTDAEIGTGANWDKTATSIKHTAGVMAIGAVAA